jgi:hypothetical protein
MRQAWSEYGSYGYGRACRVLSRACLCAHQPERGDCCASAGGVALSCRRVPVLADRPAQSDAKLRY